MERLTRKDFKYGGNITQGMKIYNKLFDIEDLEEKLGIDLITLFKGLSNGIYIKIINGIDFFKRPRLYYSNDFECWCFELGFGAYVIELKDYGKTWALRKEDLEDEKLV